MQRPYRAERDEVARGHDSIESNLASHERVDR
jgi:hypothetical protein